MTELSLYFSEEITKINKRFRPPLSDNITNYLSSILSRLSLSEVLYQDDTSYIFDIYKKCLELENASEKLMHYKYLGDYTLVITGYFPESLKMKPDYYINTGISAYEQVWNISNNQQYLELAKNYNNCLNILNDFSAAKVKNDYIKLLKLYDIWKKNNNILIKQKLISAGFITEKMDIL